MKEHGEVVMKWSDTLSDIIDIMLDDIIMESNKKTDSLVSWKENINVIWPKLRILSNQSLVVNDNQRGSHKASLSVLRLQKNYLLLRVSGFSFLLLTFQVVKIKVMEDKQDRQEGKKCFLLLDKQSFCLIFVCIFISSSLTGIPCILRLVSWREKTSSLGSRFPVLVGFNLCIY